MASKTEIQARLKLHVARLRNCRRCPLMHPPPVSGGAVVSRVMIALWGGLGAGWMGRLPGDIRIERGHSAFYFPIVTCIVISIALSLLLSFFRR